MVKLKLNMCDPGEENEMYMKDKYMLDICEILTNKGYITKFSCEGHEEELCITIHDGKVYGCITPYLLFDRVYEFPSIPDYWKIDERDLENFPDSCLRLFMPGETDENLTSYYYIREATEEDVLVFKTKKEPIFSDDEIGFVEVDGVEVGPEVYEDFFVRFVAVKNFPGNEEILKDFRILKDKYLKSLRDWANALPEYKNKVDE